MRFVTNIPGDVKSVQRIKGVVIHAFFVRGEQKNTVLGRLGNTPASSSQAGRAGLDVGVT